MVCFLFRQCCRSKTTAYEEEATRWKPPLSPIVEDGEAKVENHVKSAKSKTKIKTTVKRILKKIR